MSICKLKRSLSQYEVVYTGSKIYKSVLNICLKMPKRYTFLILQDIMNLANKVCDYTKGAKSFEPTNTKEAQSQVLYFIHAGAALDALSGKIDTFLQIPGALSYKDEDNKKTKGVTEKQLQELSTYLKKEKDYIQKSIKDIKKKFPDLIEKNFLKERYYI